MHSERLTAIFGAWPSFHDAEVHRCVLMRSAPGEASLELLIHLWEITDELDPSFGLGGDFECKRAEVVEARPRP